MVVDPAARSGAVTRSTTAHARATTTNEPWMYRYTTTNFTQLHALLYPILHELAMIPSNGNSPFTKCWKQLTNRNQLALHPKMTWKQAQVCLGISDIAQYKDFILQCPKIQDRVKIIYNKGALDMGIIQTADAKASPVTSTNNFPEVINLDSTSTISSGSIINHPAICDESPDVIYLYPQVTIL